MHDSAWICCLSVDWFGQVSLPDELNGSHIHRLENFITMNATKRGMFGWLEETASQGLLHNTRLFCFFLKDIQITRGPWTPNCYRPNAVASPFLSGIPPFVTFTFTNAALPLPSSHYLRLQALCARVAHLSGAGQYIETVSRELEEICVLVNDGTSALDSADALRHVLFMVNNSVHWFSDPVTCVCWKILIWLVLVKLQCCRGDLKSPMLIQWCMSDPSLCNMSDT